MSVKALDLISTFGQTLLNLRFRERAKERPTDFTRDRKIGFVGVMCRILNLFRRATQSSTTIE